MKQNQCNHQEWGNDRHCKSCGKCATEIVKELEAKLAQRDDDYDEAWSLYQQAEDLISKYEALPEKWRAETYWDDPVEECAMAIEYIRDVAEEEAIKKVLKK